MSAIAALFFTLLLAPIASAQAATQTTIRYSLGTGFFVSLQGHVITNAHVIDECRGPIQIRTLQGTWNVREVARDAALDLALLQSTDAAGYSPLPLRSDTTHLPDRLPAVILGYPGQGPDTPIALPITLSTQLFVPDVPLSDAQRMLFFDSVANHGNSGGPLIDRGGNVLGVVTAMGAIMQLNPATGKAEALRQTDMAVPIETVRDFLRQHRVIPLSRDIDTNYPLDLLQRQVGASVGHVMCESGR